MKNHRSRGKAAAVVVPRHGRVVRLSGGEKRRWRGRRSVSHEVLVAGVARHDIRVLAAGGPGPAAPLPRTAKEKQEFRARRATAKHTPAIFLGRVTRAARERFAALQRDLQKKAAAP